MESFGQIDIRIKVYFSEIYCLGKVCDFLALPQLNVDETIARLMIFSYPSLQLIRVYKFRTQPIFDLYDTNEIIDTLPDENENMDFVNKDRDIKSEVWETGDDIDE